MQNTNAQKMLQNNKYNLHTLITFLAQQAQHVNNSLHVALAYNYITNNADDIHSANYVTNVQLAFSNNALCVVLHTTQHFANSITLAQLLQQLQNIAACLHTANAVSVLQTFDENITQHAHVITQFNNNALAQNNYTRFVINAFEDYDDFNEVQYSIL
jgi:excinuclease UvrABC nuclease subunit